MSTNFPPKGDSDKKLGAAFAPLQVSAQDTPNMTVKVRAGSFFNSQNVFVEYVGGNTSNLIPPASNVVWAVVLLSDVGTLQVVYGAPSTTPSFPTLPLGHLPLAAIYLPSTATRITTSMIVDVRPVLRTVDIVPNIAAELQNRPTITDMNNAIAAVSQGGGGSVDAHTHVAADVTDFATAANALIATAIAGKANASTSLAGYGITNAYTKAEVDAALVPLATSAAVTAALATKANNATTLGGYGIADAYTKTEIDTTLTGYVTAAAVTSALAAKADVAATLAGYGITNAYTKAEVDSALVAKAAAAHTHVVSDITDFTTATDTRAAAIVAAATIAQSQVTGLVAALADKASATHTHSAADLPVRPYDLSFQTNGKPTANAVVFRFKAPRAITILTTGHTSIADTPITAVSTATFDIQLNGVSVGSITFSDVVPNGQVTIATEVNVSVGDVIRVIAPAVQDAELGDIAVTLMANVA